MAPLSWTWFFLLLTTAYGSHQFVVGGQADNSRIEESSIFSRRADFDDLDLDLDLTAEESANVPHTDDQPEARYRNPFPYAFNGGKPFSLLKDPITGQIDFEKAPPLKAVNFTDQYEDIDDTNDEETGKHVEAYLSRKSAKGKNGIAIGPNEINPFSPSFHDFLNLPVQYSSDKYGKDKYPLISSSYANTKVQSGSNLYSTYNHRPYHEATTRAPVVVTRRAYTTQSTTEGTTTTTTTTTTKPIIITRPTTTTKPTTTTRPTTTTKPTTTTTTKPTTVRVTERVTERTTKPTIKVTIKPTTKPTRPTTIRTTTEIITTTNKPTPKPTERIKTEPPVTTWKPKIPSRYEEYDDILPIEKLQTPKYGDRHTTKAPIVEEYVYDYEEEGQDQGYVVTSSPKDETTPRDKTTTPISTEFTSTQPTVKITENSETKPQQLVTSMPLDNENTENMSPYENAVEGHRPDFAVISGHVHFPNSHSRPILPESTSNIVIPPDQDTVSFVLGNRQNVEGSYYTHGSAGDTYSGVIGEGSFRPLIGSHSPVSVGTPTDGSKWYNQRPISGIFNFPSSIPNSGEPIESHLGSNGPVSYSPGSNGPLSHSPGSDSPVSHSNGPHSPGSSPSNGFHLESNDRIPNAPVTSSLLPNSPVSFPNSPNSTNSPIANEVDSSRRPVQEENYNKGYIVFPGPSKNQEAQRPVEEHVVIINEADGTIQEFTTSSTTMTSVDQNEKRPPLPSGDLTPPIERPRPNPGQRPPYYFHYQQLPTTRPEFSRPSRLPMRQKPPMEPVIFKRRPVTPDTKLPNILPQFRPNAKTSHGHRGAETIGTIPAQVYRPRPPPSAYSRRPSPPPSFRLSPPPHPVHHSLRIANVPKEEMQNSDLVKRTRHPGGSLPIRENERKQNHFPVALGRF